MSLCFVNPFPTVNGSSNNSSDLIHEDYLKYLQGKKGFNEDYKDGSLDLVLASGKSLFVWASIKIFVNWYFSSLPLIFLSLVTSMTFSNY